MKFSKIPLVAHLRGNHALEHATMHVLVQETPGSHMVARTTPSGFTLYGEVTAEAVTRSAQEALARLQAGQHYLAIHPNCGTNIATAGVLAGFGAFLALEANRTKSRWERLSQVLWATTLGVLAAQPLGRLTQAWLTTSPRVEGARIAGVTSRPWGRFLRHDVEVRWE
jgi:predicted alpha/beta hydrolase